MEWIMLNESKKLFPHWLDKSENSNFTKHLTILNNQQMDMRHKLKTLEWGLLLNKPLQIHKTQTEPYKWKMEFLVDVPRLKEVNVYKNPIIVDNEVVNNFNVVNGYYSNGDFYKTRNTQLTNLLASDVVEDGFEMSTVDVSPVYKNLITPVEDYYYFDLIDEQYYHYKNGEYVETEVNDLPSNSLIHSTSYIDNYTHFSRYIHYEDITGSVLINRYVTDDNGDIEYKSRLNYSSRYITHEIENGNIKRNKKNINIVDNGKTEFFVDNGLPELHYNTTLKKYGYFDNDEFKEIHDDNIIYVNYDDGKIEGTDDYDLGNVYGYYYIDNDNNVQQVNLDDGTRYEFDEEYGWYYLDENNRIKKIDIESKTRYIFTDNTGEYSTSCIPLIETIDETPLISDDRYVLEVRTWDDFHFLKGYPEIDFVNYEGNLDNNTNVLTNDDKTYDRISIQPENISNQDYLTFRVHQNNLKLIEIFKNNILVYTADFIIDHNLNSYFAHVQDDIYNYNDNQIYTPFKKNSKNIEQIDLDVNEYVYRIPLFDEDKIFDENTEWNYELNDDFFIKVTFYSDSSDPYNTEKDKVITKKYVYNDSIFYHDVSLDVLGKIWNVPRHTFIQPKFDTIDEQIDFYNNTYPTYCNTLQEDDYHYQKRLEYYINNYNKRYFPELEIWKYFHIDSQLVNRKVIIAEQNYSYMRTLNPDEYKYINELSTNKLNSVYLDNSDYEKEVEVATNLLQPVDAINGNKPASYLEYESTHHDDENYILDENGEIITDIYGTPVKTNYDYIINAKGEYIINYKSFSRKFNWYVVDNEHNYSISLIDSLKVVPNTQYQLRFCVKEYPASDIRLRLVYKNDNNDIREVREFVPERKDYDELHEYNELVYTDYEKDYGLTSEYICTTFETLDTAQNLEIILESEDEFKVSDITLQRIVVNHFDSEYMRTSTNYNSCVYDLYVDYDSVPSNIKYNDLTVFNKVLNRSLPISKIGYFNFIINSTDTDNDLFLDTETEIYLDNLLAYESSAIDALDYGTGNNKYVYRFNKYIKKGTYKLSFSPYSEIKTNIVTDFNIDITSIIFREDNTAIKKTEPLNLKKGEWEDNTTFIIEFENESDNSMEITIYREKNFEYKDFKLIRESPLTIEEITK